MRRVVTGALMAITLAGCVAVPYYPETPVVGVYAYPPPPPATVYFRYHYHRR